MNALDAEKLQSTKLTIQQGVKSKMFDIMAAVILIVVIAISLGVIERRKITLYTLGNILVECIPLFFASILLNKNYYTKGVFAGKNTKKFVAVCLEYSKNVDDLTGEQMNCLDDFCQQYNDDALSKMQNAYLKRAVISYELFDTELKFMTDYKLTEKYGNERAKYIIKAKRCKVKGLCVNSLLGNNDSEDVTDIGLTESQLSKKHGAKTSLFYLLSVVVMSLIGIKNIMEWGWFGTFLVLFKCVYIFCRSYMSYFDGYNDITINVVNHINRKTDILKQFFTWYNCRKRKSELEQ